MDEKSPTGKLEKQKTIQCQHQSIVLGQTQLELLIRPGYRACIDSLIKAAVANLSVSHPHYTEGRNCDVNLETKPTVWALRRYSNRVSNEGQTGGNLENEPSH